MFSFLFLGYIYKGIYTAEKGIKKLFYNTELYNPYTIIIKNHWHRVLRKSLHGATYWLNPIFQYGQESFCKKPKVVVGVMDMIERYSSDGIVVGLCLMDKLKLFREHEGSFGRTLAFAIRNTTRAVLLLPGVSEIGVSLRESTLKEGIGSSTKGLITMRKDYKKSYDPIDYESIDKIEFSVVDEISEGELSYNGLEIWLKNSHQTTMSQQCLNPKFLMDCKKSYDPVDYENIDKIEFWVVDEIPQNELIYNGLEHIGEEEPPNYN
uniref:Uncharacterized protein n=1 Tax=Lactuca sativa TaxID=4236 RepID=A0A9R1XIT0_LACSA|nr:hypothetical protein LSAT_V11C400189880 [Lactuca sativa]